MVYDSYLKYSKTRSNLRVHQTAYAEKIENANLNQETADLCQ